MIDKQDKLFKDIEAVRQITVVPNMLDVICQTTGMGFAAVARVTNDRWLACSVRDEVAFGLQAGEELKLETTICNEVKDLRKPIVIDHVNEDVHFRNHHTPRMYGFQSYISVPIMLKDGTFFGTLCALDPKPAKLSNTRIIGTFTMFAELLSFHLQSVDLLERSHLANIELNEKNKILTEVNKDLDTFVYTASHDLKSPVNNIQGLLDVLSKSLNKASLDRGRILQIVEMIKSSIERLGITIKDLTTIMESDNHDETEMLEATDIVEIIDTVKKDLTNQIQESNAKIIVNCKTSITLNFSKNNFRSIIYNLLSNAIKYHSPERYPEIIIDVQENDGKVNLSVKDNGLGIPADKQDKLFTMFKRFHNHVEGSGIGLFLVKRMVEKAGGTIKVASKVDQGTIFSIALN